MGILTCTPWFLQRLSDRAPPARRIASYARSYVCFGPIIPVPFARERLGAWRNITSYKQGGRARPSQALLARNKRRSERSSRCAARAALDLDPTLTPRHTPTHHRISRRTNKAVAHACHRHYWPETNVGASAARDAPRGRRSVSQATHLYRHTLKATPPGMTLRNGRVCLPWFFWGGQKSSAARAAHRELRSLLRLFLASNASDRRARPFCLYDTISRQAPRRPRANPPEITGPKQTSERSSRCAARAALDLAPTLKPPPYTYTPQGYPSLQTKG